MFIRGSRVQLGFSVLRCSYSEKVATMPSELAVKRGSSCPPPPERGQLRLYSMRFCPWAQRTRLFLAAKGIEHETINIKLNEKPKWLFEKNPIGKVPVLEKDGEIVYESLLCNEYLDHTYPDNRLTPSDPVEKMRQSLVLSVFEAMIAGPFYGYAMATEDNYAALSKKLGFGLQHLEKSLTQPFFGGDQPGALDYNIWPWFERIFMIQNRYKETSAERIPRLTAWMERMLEQPAVKACYLSPKLHAQFSKGLMAGNADYDAGLQERWSSL